MATFFDCEAYIQDDTLIVPRDTHND